MWALAILLAAILLTSPVGAEAERGDRMMLNERARQVIEVMQSRRTAADVFTAQFLAEVGAARFEALARQLEAENGRILSAEDIEPASTNTAALQVRFAKGSARASLTLEPAAPFKVSGFRIGPVIPANDTASEIAADFAALPGKAGFLVMPLDGEPAIASGEAGRQLAIGSTFKLWVLDALAEEVVAGRRKWDEVVRLGPRSLPGGMTQDWPPDAPVTVETLATLMMAISDNTATDTLMTLIGRERISARVRSTGHSASAQALPLLTTAEAFALKLGPADRCAAYARGDEAERTRLLAQIDTPAELTGVDASALGQMPVAIDSVEWFASPDDIARVLDALRKRDDPRTLAILGTATGLNPVRRRQFDYAGYKGGSESGVLNLSWLLREKAGRWWAVTASWNDPAHPLDKAKLDRLAARLIALVADRH
jgi:beta-lactamase class A